MDKDEIFSLNLNIKNNKIVCSPLCPCLRRFCALGVTHGERRGDPTLNSGIPSTTIRLCGEIFFDIVAASLK